jgi:rhodanese-related sulfurtransferase
LAVRDVAAAHHDQLQALALAYLGERDQLDEIDRDELMQRLSICDVIVIDVRPSAEYAAGHIAGARSIPLEHLAHRLDSLPEGVAVVAYCRGPYCVMADEAVDLLRHHGRQAARLADGYPEWRRAELPVAVACET